MLSKTEFLKKYNITEKDFDATKLEWAKLGEIYNDYISSLEILTSIGQTTSNSLQQTSSVHSVRYRVKDPEHLIEKIIRKVKENPERKINLENYRLQITDLIGIRAIHLFKSDWENIHNHIINNYDLAEKQKAYMRAGDSEEIRNKFLAGDFDVQVHKAGYRSLHYVIKTKPTKVEYFVEIQVRTIFEEGWSEVDHRIRYPYDTNNDLVNSLLMIFNRLAGSADEISEYTKSLSLALAFKEKEHQHKVAEMDSEILELKSQITKLKLKKAEKDNLYKTIKSIESKKFNSSSFASLMKGTSMSDFIDATNFSKTLLGYEPVKTKHEDA